MSRTPTPTNKPPTSRMRANVDVVRSRDAALVRVSGLVDEHFAGFGEVGEVRAVALDVSGMTRMTSFGVRQWINALDALPKSTDVYLLGCPTFFVDQLNMVLNFGGACKVLTVSAPFTCASCGVESSEPVDVCAERATLVQGSVSERTCTRCSQRLELDETHESYFAFVRKYAATGVNPAAAQLLAAHGLYVASQETVPEKPAKVLKLVHGAVTYFRITGTIGASFRARPFLIGAEGEIVLDLAEVDRFDPAGHTEWKKLLKGLATQVPSVTLVDVNQSYLSTAGDTLVIAGNVIVASLLVARGCLDCDRVSLDSLSLTQVTWPITFRPGVCGLCGGGTVSQMQPNTFAPLQKASTIPPAATAKLIAHRDELVSRARTDANVAQAGDSASAAISADDTILGKYKIVHRLSVGGMAEVFLANQVGIGGFEKPVALKRIQRKLLDSRHLAIDMFLNEAKIAGRLTHPNIVQVLDVAEVSGSLYLAMEYVHGKDLREVTKRLKQNGSALLPLGESLFIIREVAKALHHAYWATDNMTGKRLSVVHRDVSPHNVILSYDGRVKLIDFGVAMSSVTEHAESIVVGKWHYMAPEATTNEPVDHRSDLFSLGVILYLLVSGKLPFTDREPKAILKKIRAGTYAPINEVADVPEALATLVHRMLSLKPDHRPQRGEEVVAQLTEIAHSSGIESSSGRIADLLADLFPDEASSSLEHAALEIHLGDASGSKPSSQETIRFDNVPDVSVALQRRSDTGLSKISVTPGPLSKTISVTPGPVSKSISVTPGPVSKSISVAKAKLPEARSTSNASVLLVMLAFAIAIAAAAYFLLPTH